MIRSESSNVHVCTYCARCHTYRQQPRFFSSRMKMAKTRLCSRLNDVNLARLMKIAIEGPQLSKTDFSEIFLKKHIPHFVLVIFNFDASICSVD